MSTTLLPTSGGILGALVNDLHLSLQPPEIQRSSREYLSGRRSVIKDETREAIIRAIGAALVVEKYIPDVQPLPPPFDTGTVVDLTATAIEVWAHQWDAVVAGIESEALGNAPPEAVALACMRLVVVELAMRIAAFARLAHGRPTVCDCGCCTGEGIASPHWSEATGRRVLLNELKKQVGATSLDKFAALIDFSPSAVDEWFRETDPTPPGREATETIATAIALKSPDKTIDRTDTIIRLRWQFALAAVADRLVGVLGRERVTDLGWAFARFVAVAKEFLRCSGMREADFRRRMVEIVMGGSRAPQVSFLLNTLATSECDAKWVAAIRATGNGWGPAIQTTIKIAQSKVTVADMLVKEDGLEPAQATMLAEIVTHDLPYGATHQSASSRAKADALVRLSVESQQRGDLASSAVYLRGAADLDPQRPELHQDLGGTLGKIGKFDEGLAECRRAIELRPGWPIPLVQIGIILLDANRNDEALAHLEHVTAAIPWTVTLGHSLGIAQMRTHRYSEAIVTFERVLADVPKHGSALDLAAHCYLMLQDWKRGRALAKEAHAVGMHETWTALEAGQYHRHANELKKARKPEEA